MSSFIVRFRGARPSDFRGEVRHVSTGETMRFESATELLAFFEEMTALTSSLPQESFPDAALAPAGPRPRSPRPGPRRRSRPGS